MSSSDHFPASKNCSKTDVPFGERHRSRHPVKQADADLDSKRPMERPTPGAERANTSAARAKLPLSMTADNTLAPVINRPSNRALISAFR
jgi:hypothetical protein